MPKSRTKKKKNTPETKKIKVFSTAFASMVHNNLIAEDQKFEVECNKDGVLGDFDSLDEANEFAGEHRKNNPGHKLMVTTTQTT